MEISPLVEPSNNIAFHSSENYFERITRQMLVSESLPESNWEGLYEKPGIEAGIGILKYLDKSTYFSDKYRPAFTNAIETFEQNEFFNYYDKTVKTVYEIIKKMVTSLANVNKTGEFKLLTGSFRDCNVMDGSNLVEAILTACGEVDKKIMSSLPNGICCRASADKNGNFLNFEQSPQIGIECSVQAILETFGGRKTGKGRMIRVCSNRILNMFLQEFITKNVCQSILQSNNVDNRIIPCGFRSLPSAHQTFAYLKRNASNPEYYDVQEVNFGAGAQSPSVDSAYTKNSSFGRLVTLSKDQLVQFFIGNYQLRTTDKDIPCGISEYKSFWNQLCANGKRQSSFCPWLIMPRIPIQKSGDCVMRSTMGVAEIKILDAFNEILDDKTSEDGEESQRKMEIRNRIAVKSIDVISRIEILRQYLKAHAGNPTKDSIALIQLGMGKISREIARLNKTIANHSDVIIPFFEKDFQHRLDCDFCNLRSVVEEHLNSDIVQLVTYKETKQTKLFGNVNSFEFERDKNVNYIARSNMQTLFAKLATREECNYKYISTKKINLDRVKKGDIKYITQRLDSFIAIANENANYMQLIAKKMMEIIQNIPIGCEKNGDKLVVDYKILSSDQCLNLLESLKNSIAFIDLHYAAIDDFYKINNESSSDLRNLKNFNWQIHNEKFHFNQYDATLSVNAHAVSSIIAFTILSENNNFFNELRKEENIFDGVSFQLEHFIKFYESFACHMHNPGDCEVIRKIYQYYLQHKNAKSLIFDYSEKKDKSEECAIEEVDDTANIFLKLADQSAYIESSIREKYKDFFMEFNIDARSALLMFTCGAFNVYSIPDVQRSHFLSKFSRFFFESDAACARSGKLIQCGIEEELQNLEAYKKDINAQLLFKIPYIFQSAIKSFGSFQVSQARVREFEIGTNIQLPTPLDEAKLLERQLLQNHENKIRCDQEIQFNVDNFLAQFNICVEDNIKTINEIHVFEENLDAFTQNMNYCDQMLQYFNRKNENKTIFGEIQKIDIASERAITLASKNNWRELCVAVDSLEEAGWQKFCKNKVRIDSIAMVEHVKSSVLRNIIHQNDNALESEVFRKEMKNELIIQMKKIESLKMSATNSYDEKIIMLMENECILNMLELYDIKRSDAVNSAIDPKYINTLIINSYHLVRFNGSKLPKGMLYALFDAHNILDNYWKRNPNQATETAQALYYDIFKTKEKLSSINRGNVLLRSGDGKCVIDIANLSITKNGELIEPCNIYHLNDDVRRLFGNKNLDAYKNNSAYFFHDDKLGPVQILIKNRANSCTQCEYAILCELDNDGQQWAYLGVDTLKNDYGRLKEHMFSIPDYFKCDDYNIFINCNGDIRIYGKNDPGKILFKTVKLNINDTSTFALKSCQRKDDNYYVSLQGSADQENNKIFKDPVRSKATEFYDTPFELFENPNYICKRYDGNGNICGISFPRYRDENGDEILLLPQKKGDGEISWRLSSNTSLELCPGVDAPIFNDENYPILQQNESDKFNPLIEYSHYLCFKNTDSNNAGNFMYLLPDVHISRPMGLSHNHTCYFPKVDAKHPFIGTSTATEVSYFIDPFLLIKNDVVAKTPLGTLQLVYTLQAQSEYRKAIECLRRLSPEKSIEDEEIKVLNKIVFWFKYGHEQSPESANLIFSVIERMLRWNHKSDKLKEAVKAIMKEDDGQFFENLFRVYLLGHNSCLETTRMHLGAEIYLWKYFILCSGGSTKLNSPLKEALFFGENHPTMQSHLEKLIYLRDKKIARHSSVLRAQKKQFKEAKNLDMYYYLKEITPFHVQADIELNNQPNIYSSIEGLENLMGKCKTAEDRIIENAKKIFAIKEKSIFDNVDDIDIEKCEAQKIPTLNGESDEHNKSINYFNDEIEKGAKIQAKKRSDPFLKEEFISSIDRKKMVQFMKSLDDEIDDLRKLSRHFMEEIRNLLRQSQPNEKFEKATYDSKAISVLIRNIYNLYTGGSIKRALRCVRDSYPQFNEVNLEKLVSGIEHHIIGLNSMRYLIKTKQALLEFCPNPEGDKPFDIPAWETALTLMRALRSSNFYEYCDTNEKMVVKAEKLLYQKALILEDMAQLRMRPDQIEKTQFTLNILMNNKSEKCGALIEQIMGSGKSKVLIPEYILFALSMSKKLGQDNTWGYPVIVSHITQMSAVMKELPSIFRNFGINIEAMDLDFQQLKTLDGMRNLREKLELMAKERNTVPVFSSRDLMALYTLFRSFNAGINQNDQEYLREFKNLMTFFDQCTALFDEIHLTANPKEEFIIEASLDGMSERKEINSAEINFLTNFMFRILDKNLLDKCKNNQQSQITRETLTNSLKIAVGKQLDQLKLIFSDEEKEIFISFLLGEYDGKDVTSEKQHIIEDVFRQCKSLKIENLIYTLRANCCEYFVRDFAKVCDKNFGYDPASGSVIPYANSKPTASTFQDPREAVFFTMLTVASDGFSRQAIDEFIVDLFKSASNEATKNKILLKETNSYKKFNEYFSNCFVNNYPIELIDIVQQTEKGFHITEDAYLAIWNFLQTENGAKCHRELLRIVCKKAASWNPYSYATPPSTIIGTMFHCVIGLSGTTLNRSAFPLRIGKDEIYSPQLGSIGTISSKLIDDIISKKSFICPVGQRETNTQEAKTNSAHLHTMRASEILDEWREYNSKERIKNLRLFVDAGSLLASQNTREIVYDIANFIRDNNLDVKAIEWYDATLQTFAIANVSDVLESKGNNFYMQRLTDPSKQRPSDKNKLFTYLPQEQATGSDPLVMKNGIGIVTMNPVTLEMSAFSQSIMRLRKFLEVHGQSADIVVLRETMKNLELIDDKFDITDGNQQKEIIIKFIECVINNTDNDTKKQRIQSVTIQLDELIKITIEKWLDERVDSNFAERSRLKDICFNFLVQEKMFNISQWEHFRCWESARKNMMCYFEEKISKLKHIIESNQLGNKNAILRSIEEMRKSAENIINCIPESEQTLAFPDKSDQQAANDAGHENQIEKQAITETQKEKEQQAEQQKEHVDELDQSRYQELEMILNLGSEIDSKHAREQDSLRMEDKKTADDLYSQYWSNASENSANALTLKDHFSKFANTIQDIRDSNFHQNLANKFRNFSKLFDSDYFNQFVFTSNFLQAANAETCIFHRSQIIALDVLIFWDAELKNFKCMFVTQKEASELKSKIEAGNILNCYLCTINGNPLAKHGKIPNENAAFQSFITSANWMAKFFNSDIDFLQKSECDTYDMFQTELNFKENKNLIHDFLILRYMHPQKGYARIIKSRIVSECKLNSIVLADAMQEIGLNEDSSFTDFIGKVQNSECLFTENILIAVMQFAKKYICSDENFREIIISKTRDLFKGMSIDHAKRKKMINKLIASTTEETILQLFLNKNTESLKLLNEICKCIYEIPSRLERITNPQMAALICLASNENLDDTSIINTEDNNEIDFPSIIPALNQVNFSKIPIAYWIKNGIFNAENGCKEIFKSYIKSDTFKNLDRRSKQIVMAGMSTDNRLVEAFISQKNGPLSDQDLEQMDILLSVLENARKEIGNETQKCIDQIINVAYSSLGVGRISELEKIAVKHKTLFRFIVVKEITKNNDAMKELLFAPWFNALNVKREYGIGKKTIFTNVIMALLNESENLKKFLEKEILNKPECKNLSWFIKHFPELNGNVIDNFLLINSEISPDAFCMIISALLGKYQIQICANHSCQKFIAIQMEFACNAMKVSNSRFDLLKSLNETLQSFNAEVNDGEKFFDTYDDFIYYFLCEYNDTSDNAASGVAWNLAKLLVSKICDADMPIKNLQMALLCLWNINGKKNETAIYKFFFKSASEEKGPIDLIAELLTSSDKIRFPNDFNLAELLNKFNSSNNSSLFDLIYNYIADKSDVLTQEELVQLINATKDDDKFIDRITSCIHLARGKASFNKFMSSLFSAASSQSDKIAAAKIGSALYDIIKKEGRDTFHYVLLNSLEFSNHIFPENEDRGKTDNSQLIVYELFFIDNLIDTKLINDLDIKRGILPKNKSSFLSRFIDGYANIVSEMIKNNSQNIDEFIKKVTTKMINDVDYQFTYSVYEQFFCRFFDDYDEATCNAITQDLADKVTAKFVGLPGFFELGKNARWKLLCMNFIGIGSEKNAWSCYLNPQLQKVIFQEIKHSYCAIMNILSYLKDINNDYRLDELKKIADPRMIALYLLNDGDEDDPLGDFFEEINNENVNYDSLSQIDINNLPQMPMCTWFKNGIFNGNKNLSSVFHQYILVNENANDDSGFVEAVIKLNEDKDFHAEIEKQLNIALSNDSFDAKILFRQLHAILKSRKDSESPIDRVIINCINAKLNQNGDACFAKIYSQDSDFAKCLIQKSKELREKLFFSKTFSIFSEDEDCGKIFLPIDEELIFNRDNEKLQILANNCLYDLNIAFSFAKLIHKTNADINDIKESFMEAFLGKVLKDKTFFDENITSTIDLNIRNEIDALIVQLPLSEIWPYLQEYETLLFPFLSRKDNSQMQKFSMNICKYLCRENAGEKLKDLKSVELKELCAYYEEAGESFNMADFINQSIAVSPDIIAKSSNSSSTQQKETDSDKNINNAEKGNANQSIAQEFDTTIIKQCDPSKDNANEKIPNISNSKENSTNPTIQQKDKFSDATNENTTLENLNKTIIEENNLGKDSLNGSGPNSTDSKNINDLPRYNDLAKKMRFRKAVSITLGIAALVSILAAVILFAISLIGGSLAVLSPLICVIAAKALLISSASLATLAGILFIQWKNKFDDLKDMTV
ncbi:MAG: hypothetical protein LBI69_00295 [Puniceicoccales bacterium]|nr:hypothetical protein [Puniceicoccales bacterium]